MCEWQLSHNRLARAFSGVWGCFRAESLLCVSGGCHIGGLRWLLCGRVVGVAGFWIALVGPGLLCVSGGCHIACRMSGVVVVWEGRWGCWVLDCLGWAGAAMCEWRLSHCVPDGVLFGHFGLLPCRIFAMCEWRLSHRRLAGAFSGVWGCFRAGFLVMCERWLSHWRSVEAFSGVWGCLGWLLCGRVVGVAGFWIALVGPGLLCVSGGCHIGGWQGHFQGFGVVFVLDSPLCVSDGCRIACRTGRFQGFGAFPGLNPCYV